MGNAWGNDTQLIVNMDWKINNQPGGPGGKDVVGV